MRRAVAGATCPVAMAGRPLAHANVTSPVDGIINHFQEALEGARGLPEGALIVAVVLIFLCFIILLHVIAVLVFGPCVYCMFLRRRRVENHRRIHDEIIDPEAETELSDLSP